MTRPLRNALAGIAALVVLAAPAMAQDTKPKLGPLATPIYAATEFFREAPAPDYWALAAYYVPQRTSSSCTSATASMAVNALRGLPAINVEPVITEAALLDTVGDAAWRELVAEGGPGTTFAEFAAYLRKSLDAYGLTAAGISVVQPADTGPDALAAFRTALADNERSAGSIMVVAFNQGVVTGDWDGPHASPVGAYDSARDRVLILDVDREWYVPYWTDTATLLAAMTKPVAAEYGRLAGDHGGYILMTQPPN